MVLNKGVIMAVRAKFKVASVTLQPHWDIAKGLTHTIKLQPVTTGSDENKAFYAATPSGQIELSILNDEIGKQFEIGSEYYIDFTKA